MANFSSNGKECIERKLQVTVTKSPDTIQQYNVTETCEWINKNKYEKVCLQFPDELLHASASIYEEIKSRTDVDLYILGDTSYASCCIDSVAAMHVQANALVHYGRNCFSKTDIPTFIVLPKRDLDINTMILNIKNYFEDEELCLFYDQEFEHVKSKISETWYKYFPNGYLALIEQNEYPHRYLGRVIQNANGNVIPFKTIEECKCVYLGSRGQTLFNYSVSIRAKCWFNIDPDKGKVTELNESTWIKRRRYLVEKCKDVKTVGLLVCKLSGDQTRDVIKRMKMICKASGKKSYIVSVGKPNVAKLANFPEIELYVLIACPENDLYSCRDFYQPIVYPYELEVALNSHQESYFTSMVTDFDELLPGGLHHTEIKAIEGADVSLITGKIRETGVNSQEESNELAVKDKWVVDTIGANLKGKSWAGLEQKLGESEVKKAEVGRKGIAIHYSSEPE